MGVYSPNDLADKFRILRNAWFNRVLLSKAHERDWEDEEQTQRRELNNQRVKALFDKQTEDIINGSNKNVTPYCVADLDPI